MTASDSDHEHDRGTYGWGRVTIRLPLDVIDRIDTQVDQGDYSNRSEAIRAALEEEYDHE